MQDLPAQLDRNHVGNVGVAAALTARPELDRAHGFSVRATPDRQFEAGAVIPLASKLANTVLVMGIRLRSCLLNRPAEIPRCVWIEREATSRFRILQSRPIEDEELIQDEDGNLSRDLASFHRGQRNGLFRVAHAPNSEPRWRDDARLYRASRFKSWKRRGIV